MDANTPLWVGLGVLGVLLIASLDTSTKETQTPSEKEKKQKTPKKVVL